MRKLQQSTYFIDRNNILKNLVTPNSDGYSVKCAALAQGPEKKGVTLIVENRKILKNASSHY